MTKPKTFVMIGGPNGSGKTTYITELMNHYDMGEFINADELTKTIKAEEGLAQDEANYKGQKLARARIAEAFNGQASFVFETVMSHVSKIEMLKKAKAMGFQAVFLYVATESPDINVERVAYRVEQGGHDVPENKIRERYVRSLDYLSDAIEIADVSYILDNTNTFTDKPSMNLIMKLEREQGLLISDEIPVWVKNNIIEKMNLCVADHTIRKSKYKKNIKDSYLP